MKFRFLSVIETAIADFCDSKGYKKPYFFQYLIYADKQCPKYLNPNDDEKHLKATDLIDILDNLDNKHRKIILDNLCQKYNFVCSDSAATENNSNSFERILLEITSTNGELSKEFITAIEDNNITDEERSKLNNIAYHFRSLLRMFELKVTNNG